MTSMNLHTVSRWILTAILCATWAFAGSSDALAQKSGSKQSKYKEVDMGIDDYDEATGIRRILSFFGSTGTSAASPADFYWERYDATPGVTSFFGDTSPAR